MKCLKCGKEIKDQNVFCRHCLEEMAAYPVKSDTHVQLPNRTETPEHKKIWRKRRKLSTSERLKHLRRVNRGLVTAVVVLTLLLAAAAVLLIHDWLGSTDLDIGRNYTFERTEN